MSYRTLVLAGLFCLAAPSLMAQGNSGGAGPPSTQPLVVLDSTGAQVGTVVDPATRSLIKYPIPGGDTVLLTARPMTLTLNRASLAFVRLYFFTTTDCTSNEAWMHGTFADSATQLTKRQAVVVSTPTSVGIFGTSVLYVSDPFMPFIAAPAGATATSEWVNGNCTIFTSWSPSLAPGPFVKFTKLEDLSAKFTSPFWIP